MFRKLLNVGKTHSNNEKLQQQQQQKNLFQLNEIRSYGFSHLCCLGYSPSLSLLAVGSKFGLVRVLGNSSVEFSYQLEAGNAIRQIEFIDCRKPEQNQQQQQQKQQQNNNSKKSGSKKSVASSNAASNEQLTSKQAAEQQQQNPSAKIVVLTDNGQLHLFELKTCKQLNYADNTTQTDGNINNSDCCQQQQQQPNETNNQAPEYTRLEFVDSLDYFKHRPDIEDRSKRVTTFEISADNQTVFVGTEGGNVYLVPLKKFYEQVQLQQQQQSAAAAADQATTTGATTTGVVSAASGKRSVTPSQAESVANGNNNSKHSLKKQESLAGDDTETAVNLSDEPQIDVSEEAQDEDGQDAVPEPFEMIKFDEHILPKLGEDIKSKKQGAVESIKKHPKSNGGATILISYHRGLNVIYDVQAENVDKYFYHNQVLESSCFADQNGDFFYTSHNDGSYIKWDVRQGSQAKANEDFLGQLYGPYPNKPTPKIQACTGLVNDQLENLIIFSGGMPRATYDDKNPVTIVRAGPDGKDTIKTVLDFTSKVLDFVVITRPRGNLGAGAKSTGGGGSGTSGNHHQGGGGGKKNKHKHQQQQKQEQQQQQQRNQPVAVALAILAEEEIVVIDLLNSESYLEFCLPYLNCVHSSAITCNQHYSDISDDLYNQLLAYNKQQLKGKLSTNEWPITGGKVIDAPELKSHDILLTGHEDGSVNFWDVSDLSMRHLLHLTTARLFSTNDDLDFAPETQAANGATNKETSGDNNNSVDEDAGKQDGSAWPPMKRVGRFDPYSDDTRLAIRRLSLCPQTGTLVVAGTGGEYTRETAIV